MRIETGDAPKIEVETNAVRHLVVSVISILVFLLGSAGLVLAIIAGIGLLLNVDLLGSYILVVVFWYVAGPCLILAGYNLWKRKKWAAQLAILIVVLDLVSLVLGVLWSTSVSIGLGTVVAWVLDIATLALLAAAWKHLR